MVIENFTTYTEEDDNNKLTVIATTATGVDVDSDEDVWLYKDKTEDYFNALNVTFETLISSASGSGALGGMGITNTIGSRIDLAATDIMVATYVASGPAYKIYLFKGNNVANDVYTCSADTPYYCTLLRAAGGDIATLDIYDDSGRTNKVDTLVVAGYGTEKWQYAFGFMNHNDGTGTDDWDGYVKNLDLKEIFIPIVAII